MILTQVLQIYMNILQVLLYQHHQHQQGCTTQNPATSDCRRPLPCFGSGLQLALRVPSVASTECCAGFARKAEAPGAVKVEIEEFCGREFVE